MPDRIYLDWNSTTPIHPDIVRDMSSRALELWGNPASVHWHGRLAREHVERVRATIARHFEAHPRDLLFTSGGTEANNLALLDCPALVTSRLEHPSITRVAEELERRNFEVRWLEVLPTGQIDLNSLDRSLRGLPEGAVVAVQAVNHETGVVQPLADAARLVHGASCWLHIDAVQALGKVPAEVYRFGDSYSIAAHKIRGPKGIGALIWRCGRKAPHPILFGGSQQRGMRPGTVDPVAVFGFEQAFLRLNVSTPAWDQIAGLRDRFELELSTIGKRNTSDAPRVAHVSSMRVTGWKGDELVAVLDVEGLCVSSGSACSAGTAEPSPVILAMHGIDCARETIRVSLGETTTALEIERACELIRRVSARRPMAFP